MHWGAQLARLQRKRHQRQTQVNVLLTLFAAITTAAFGLVLEQLLNANFDRVFWLSFTVFILSTAMTYPLWRKKESLRNTSRSLIQLSIDQLGRSGWEHDAFATPDFDSFTVIKRPYRLSGSDVVHAGDQVDSVAKQLERVCAEQHGTTIQIIPLGHFPQLLALGYRADLPAGTLLTEQVKVKTPAADTEVLTLEVDYPDELTMPDGTMCQVLAQKHMSPQEVRCVWVEFATVDDTSVQEWHSQLEGMANQAGAQVRVRAGVLAPGAKPGQVSTLSSFTAAKLVQQSNTAPGKQAGVPTLRPADASHALAQTIISALITYPNAKVHVTSRVPRTVALHAGTILSRNPAAPLFNSGNLHRAEYDPWHRLQLWGPVYKTVRDRYEHRIVLQRFNVMDSSTLSSEFDQ